MIKVGDIVRRKNKPGKWAEGEPLLASWLFNDGYFIVLDVRCAPERHEDGTIMSACLIMNSFGNTSWVDKRNLKIVVEL